MSANLLQRQLAHKLDLDPAVLSRMERESRAFRREHLNLIATQLKVDFSTLERLWLADRVLHLIENEHQAQAALELALKTYINR